MGLIVTDASVIVELLAADDSARRKAAGDRLAGGDALFAPAYLDIEVVSALRGLARRSEALDAGAPQLVRQLLRMPIRRERLTGGQANRIWELRANMTACDAGYIALAEQLGAVLVTCDAKFGASPRPHCAIELLS